MIQKKSRPLKIEGEVWNCEDLKQVIREKIDAVVKDAKLADRLENALADFVAYKPASKYMLFKEPKLKK